MFADWDGTVGASGGVGFTMGAGCGLEPVTTGPPTYGLFASDGLLSRRKAAKSTPATVISTHTTANTINQVCGLRGGGG